MLLLLAIDVTIPTSFEENIADVPGKGEKVRQGFTGAVCTWQVKGGALRVSSKIPSEKALFFDGESTFPTTPGRLFDAESSAVSPCPLAIREVSSKKRRQTV